MSDIGLQIVCDELSGRSYIDIKIGDTDLVGDDGAETAALISMFTDQRVSLEELPDFEESQRGWWGDLLSEIQDDQIGSKLWTLRREKQTTGTLQRFIDYTRDSLQWMIQDGFADDVQVDAEYIRRGFILVTVQMFKPKGDPVIFKAIWDGQGVRR